MLVTPTTTAVSWSGLGPWPTGSAMTPPGTRRTFRLAPKPSKLHSTHSDLLMDKSILFLFISMFYYDLYLKYNVNIFYK